MSEQPTAYLLIHDLLLIIASVLWRYISTFHLRRSWSVHLETSLNRGSAWAAWRTARRPELVAVSIVHEPFPLTVSVPL